MSSANRDIIKKQYKDREKALNNILDSTAPRKLIVAGPGTGKTYTFKRLLVKSESTNNLAMTFINNLVADMEVTLDNYAEVKTLHRFCTWVLHNIVGDFDIVAYLDKIISKDSEFIGHYCQDFPSYIRSLDESNGYINFFIKRGDYYNAFAFDDTVYRLLIRARNNPSIIPRFSQIVIDEFQDFNLLEVEFIKILEKRGNILIAGACKYFCVSGHDVYIVEGGISWPRNVTKLTN